MIECYETEYYVSLTFHYTKKKKKYEKRLKSASAANNQNKRTQDSPCLRHRDFDPGFPVLSPHQGSWQVHPVGDYFEEQGSLKVGTDFQHPQRDHAGLYAPLDLLQVNFQLMIHASDQRVRARHLSRHEPG